VQVYDGAADADLFSAFQYPKNLSVCFTPDAKHPVPAMEFHPEHCTLRHYHRESACALLDGKSLLFVGDSLAMQQYSALMILLGGNVSSGKVQSHASMCNHRTRAVFVRSDLALWLPMPSNEATSSEKTRYLRAHKSLRHLNPLLLMGTFEQRAVRDADVLVLGVGHHYGITSWGIQRARQVRDNNTSQSRQGPPRPDTSGLLTRSLNYTLTRLVDARRRWGHAPASVIILGAPVPIPACRRYKRPLTLTEALAARLDYHAANRDSKFARVMEKFPVSLLELWQQLFEANAVLQWTAGSFGASFVDVAPISMMRPDAAAAQQTGDYDCLHSCVPGPVDTFVRLLLGLIDDNRAVFLGGDRPSPSRFFKGALANASTFLFRAYSQSATSHLESCTEDPGCHDDEGVAAGSSPPRMGCCAVGSQPNAMIEAWWPLKTDGAALTRDVGIRTLAD
jgi:hypothetical protein